MCSGELPGTGPLLDVSALVSAVAVTPVEPRSRDRAAAALLTAAASSRSEPEGQRPGTGMSRFFSSQRVNASDED
jgi:hypothetical protein